MTWFYFDFFMYKHLCSASMCVVDRKRDEYWPNQTNNKTKTTKLIWKTYSVHNEWALYLYVMLQHQIERIRGGCSSLQHCTQRPPPEPVSIYIHIHHIYIYISIYFYLETMNHTRIHVLSKHFVRVHTFFVGVIRRNNWVKNLVGSYLNKI